MAFEKKWFTNVEMRNMMHEDDVKTDTENRKVIETAEGKRMYFIWHTKKEMWERTNTVKI
jgi:hypothetical protein